MCRHEKRGWYVVFTAECCFIVATKWYPAIIKTKIRKKCESVRVAWVVIKNLMISRNIIWAWNGFLCIQKSLKIQPTIKLSDQRCNKEYKFIHPRQLIFKLYYITNIY